MIDINNDIMQCPTCECPYSHQNVVEVYSREQEDGPTTRIQVMDNTTTIIYNSMFNPSPRRYAVRIRFEGECGHSWWIEFAQHKGETTVTQYDVEG